MDGAVSRDVALQLMQSARLHASEVRSLLEKAVDPGYWRRLAPPLGLDDSRVATDSLDAGHLSVIRETFISEGYFQTNSVLPPAQIDWMKECVERLRREKWPVVFAFVYDEFWTIARTKSLSQILAQLFGTEFHQTSNVWVWHLSPRAGSGGWPPHIDGTGDHRVSIWIPLADATLANGCIYVIPRSAIPATLPADFGSWTSINPQELNTLLHGCRALPAKAGSILGWDHNLIHWGSTWQNSTTPRISIGMEFLGEQATSTEGELPLTEISSVPSFSKRMFLIAQSILKYSQREPALKRYCVFAEELMAACTARLGRDGEKYIP